MCELSRGAERNTRKYKIDKRGKDDTGTIAHAAVQLRL